MNARRRVKKFGSPRWKQENGVRTCIVEVTVNDEDEIFTFEQKFSMSLFLKTPLGDPLSDTGLEAITKARVKEHVSGGGLDNWPPSQPVKLDFIDYREAERWIQKAGLGR
jgi:hypothetical protein